MVFGALFRRVLMMLVRMQRMPMCHFGTVRGLLISGLGVLCRLAMMFRRVFVIVRRDLKVLMDVVAIHCRLPVIDTSE
jgi:hypothetical protein